MTHLKGFLRKLLSKENLDVAYTLVQIFIFESQLSQTERVLFLRVCFSSRQAVIGQSETRNVIDWSFIVAILCVITESVILVLNHNKCYCCCCC